MGNFSCNGYGYICPEGPGTGANSTHELNAASVSNGGQPSVKATAAASESVLPLESPSPVANKRGLALGPLDESVFAEGVQAVTCEDLESNLAGTVVVDIRGTDFFGGSIPDAVRLPFEEVLANPAKLKEFANSGHQWIVFCCMNGDQRSRLCAEQLYELIQQKQQDGGEILDLQVGYLEGGMASWVNRLNAQNRLNDHDLLTDFSNGTWKPQETGGPLVHLSAAGSEAEVFSVWESNDNISRYLRRAKSFIVQNMNSTLEVVGSLQKVRNSVPGAILPEEVELKESDVLGSGASSVVMRAVHRPTGKSLAVKAINIENPVNRRQLLNSLSFFSEKWISEETTKGLMRLHCVFSDEKRVFLAMEFMDIGGVGTLMSWMPPKKGLPEIMLVHTIYQALNGLKTLHGHSLIHRDIKPDNILVNTSGEVRVCDFGLSTLLEEDQVTLNKQEKRKGLVRATSFVGTESYLSPQRAKGQGITQKEDIWAMGLVMHELATTIHAFDFLEGDKSEKDKDGSYVSKQSSQSEGFAERFGKLLQKVEADGGLTMPPPSAGCGTFSKELQDVVALCLRKRPSERPIAADLITKPFFGKVGKDGTGTFQDWKKWFAQYKPKGL